MQRASGAIGSTRISALLTIPLLQSYPFIGLFSGLALFIGLSIASSLKSILSVSAPLHLFNCLLEIFGCRVELYILNLGRLVILIQKIFCKLHIGLIVLFLWDLDHHCDWFVCSTKSSSGKLFSTYC